MGVNADNIFIGVPEQSSVTGAIDRGPVLRLDDIPETFADFLALSAGRTNSGYVTEDGVTLTPNESRTGIKDWSLTIVRNIVTEFSGQIGWGHLELNAEAARIYFGDDNVEVTDATDEHGTQMRAALNGKERPRRSWRFRMKDGPRRAGLLVPDGQITDRAEIPLSASGPVTLPVTLDTYPDSFGNNAYLFTDNGVLALTV